MTAPDVRTPGGNPADAEQEKEHPDCATDAERKAWATLQAEAALAGCTLHRTDDGKFLLTRWTLCRELPNLAAVREMLARIGGAR